jgi:hypothetical protein
MNRVSTNFDIRIRPTQAYHDDFSGYSDSFGFLIDIRLPRGNGGKWIKYTIGYTGDTKWVYSQIPDPLKKRMNGKHRVIKDIVEKNKYSDCHALIVHLGSLIGRSQDGSGYNFKDYNQCLKNSGQDPCEELIREKGHPYVIGLLRILSSLYEKRLDNGSKLLVLLSEFGEELRGKIRVDLTKRLHNVYGERIHLLPVDVGISIQTQRCEYCVSNATDLCLLMKPSSNTSAWTRLSTASV